VWAAAIGKCEDVEILEFNVFFISFLAAISPDQLLVARS
jgi:hypothetical protein